MTLVFNASPLIVLAKAGLLDDWVGLGSPCLVPQAVVDEICRVDDALDPARVWLEKPGLGLDVVATPPMLPFLAGWDLGAGESAVISLTAAQPGAVAVLDDLAARRCAQAHGIRIGGGHLETVRGWNDDSKKVPVTGTFNLTPMLFRLS